MTSILYHRLVVKTQYLTWSSPPDIDTEGVVIRFTTTALGELVQPTMQVQTAPDHYSVQGGGSGKIEHRGRFIEVICAGDTAEHAEMRAHALLGFLGLCFGDHAIGEVAFSEAYQGRPGGDVDAVRIPIMHYIPWEVIPPETEAMQSALQTVLASLQDNTALALALRWYEHGIRLSRSDPRDRLLSFFIGIEGLVNAFASAQQLRSSLAPLADDERFLAALAEHATARDPQAVKRLANGMAVNPTARERFEFYATRHGLETDLSQMFQRLSRLRSPTVHGSFVPVTEDDALDARSLLRTLLKAELKLMDDFVADVHPGWHTNSVEWDADSGWIVTPKVDWAKRLGMTFGGSNVE